MQLRLRRHDVRPVVDELRRKAERQLLRQGERGEVEVGRRPVGRRTAGQHRQGVAGDVQVLFQPRGQGLVGRQLAAGQGDVAVGRLPSLPRLSNQVQVLLIEGDDVGHRRQLCPDGGDLQGLAHRLAREREVGGVQLVALIVGQGGLRLDLAVDAAKGVDMVAGGGPQLEQVEVRGQGKDIGRQAEGAGAFLFLRLARRESHLRE